MASDLELINNCIAGDAVAWEHFPKQFSPKIISAIYRTFNKYSYASSSDDIHDLAQQVLLSLLEKDCEKLKKYNGINDCSFSTWLQVVVTRATINYIKQKSRKEKPLVNIEDKVIAGDKGNYSEEINNRQLITLLKEIAKNELKPREQLFLRLSFEKELDDDEVAKILNMKKNALYVLKNRLFKKIKQIFCNKYPSMMSI